MSVVQREVTTRLPRAATQEARAAAVALIDSPELAARYRRLAREFAPGWDELPETLTDSEYTNACRRLVAEGSA